MLIKGRIVTIRAIEKDDLQFLKELMNNNEIEIMTVGDHLPISMYEEEQWYFNNIGKKDFNKFIIENSKKNAVGLISLENIDWKNRCFEVPLKLVPNNKEVGIGIDAHMAMLRYGFDELQMHRAFGRTLAYNEASLNMQRLCGYVEEGRLRKAVWKNGQYHDIILTSLLREEYYHFLDNERYWDD